MKKFLTALLTAAMLFGTLLPVTFAADSWVENPDISGADLKFGMIGDSHVTSDSSILSWFQESLTAQKTIGGGTLDALALTGDVIYQNKSDEVITNRYDSVMTSLDNAGYGSDEGEVPLVFAMGNHEFPQNGSLSAEKVQESKDLFVTKTGQSLNYQTTIKGYHFIAAAPENYNLTYSSETETWLKEKIDAAISEDSNKPVFVLLHGPIQGTVFNSSTKRYSDEFLAYLKTKPQIVNLTAHWHVPAQLPQTIWQDGFTVFHTPLTGGGYLEELNCTSTGNISSVHQSSMIAVKDNVVKIYKLDLVTKEIIGDPWVIDIPSIVSDMTDEDSNNDTDHYLYSADKRQNSAVPEFPAGAEITATPVGNGITVTYPNNATNLESGSQQDGFVRAYKVEVTNESGSVLATQTYQADFYLPESSRATSYTRTIGGLGYGATFNVNVYPMSPLGVFGTPLSATCTTEENSIPANAIRYEFEDYYPITSIIKTSTLASNGKLVSSNQGGTIGNNTTVARTTDASCTFEINLPVGGEYNLEYTLGDQCGNEYVSAVTLLIDDEIIGKNDSSYAEDISVGKTYPWSYIPMRIYRKNNVTLSEGTHTVKLQVDAPVPTSQPNLFCADYLQFTPKTASISQDKVTTLEFEDYADDFVDVTPNVKTGTSQTSGSGYIHFDTAIRTDPVTLDIPVSVDAEGSYNFKYVASGNSFSVTELYLDDAETPFWTKEGNNGVALESEKINNKWTYFDQTWHQAYQYDFSATLSSGEHTIHLKLLTRPAENSQRDVCICMDYLKIIPPEMLAIKKDAATRIEFEDYQKNFSILQNDGSTHTPNISSTTRCSNGKYLGIDSTDNLAANDYETFIIPITVEQADNYDIEYVINDNFSSYDIFLNSINGLCLSNNVTTYADTEKDSDGKYTYFNSKWAPATFHNGTVFLPAGDHNLIFQIKKRSSSADYALYLDYLEFSPADSFAITDGTATAKATMAEAVTGKAILALYNDKELVSTGFTDVADATVVTAYASVPASATITHAKLFVWSDLENCIPQTAAKSFTVK